MLGHTRRTIAELSDVLSIVTVACLQDNFAYLVFNKATKKALCVDPGESAPCVAAVEELQLDLRDILCTHHHADHCGGVLELRKAVPSVRDVYGFDDRISGLTRKLVDNEMVSLLDRINIRTMHTPCHTTGSVCYHVTTEKTETSDPKGEDVGAVFTGDTLFIGGAGKFFEGTANEMYHSFFDKIFKLPPDTLVFAGHEYTESNLAFALSVEPDNGHLLEEMARVRARRELKLPSGPVALSTQLHTNLFVRCREKALAKKLGERRALGCVLLTRVSPAGLLEWAETEAMYKQVLAHIRESKNNFKK
jgi:hydroxyacylglutathione hydrolase